MRGCEDLLRHVCVGQALSCSAERHVPATSSSADARPWHGLRRSRRGKQTLTAERGRTITVAARALANAETPISTAPTAQRRNSTDRRLLPCLKKLPPVALERAAQLSNLPLDRSTCCYYASATAGACPVARAIRAPGGACDPSQCNMPSGVRPTPRLFPHHLRLR